MAVIPPESSFAWNYSEVADDPALIIRPSLPCLYCFQKLSHDTSRETVTKVFRCKKAVFVGLCELYREKRITKKKCVAVGPVYLSFDGD